MKTASKLKVAAFAFAAITSAVIAAPHRAEARMANPGLTAPSLVEDVACRTVRERVRRPNGAVAWTTRRVCTPGPVVRRGGPRCVIERQRIVRPNGAVIHKQVRRCR